MRIETPKRLQAAIQRAACFTDGEVEQAFRMFHRNKYDPYLGSEAVVCFGGARKVIEHGIRHRHRSRVR